MEYVVAGGRRFDTSAETEEKPSKISWKKSMVMVPIKDEAKSHLLRGSFLVFGADLISRVEKSCT